MSTRWTEEDILRIQSRAPKGVEIPAPVVTVRDVPLTNATLGVLGAPCISDQIMNFPPAPIVVGVDLAGKDSSTTVFVEVRDGKFVVIEDPFGFLGKWTRLPIPPSLSSYWRFPPGSRVRHLSKAALAFRRAVVREMGRQIAMPLSGRLRLDVILCFNRAGKIDLDNRAKAVLDSLQHAGVFVDDSQIDDLRLARGPKRGGGGQCFVRLSASCVPKEISEIQEWLQER